VSKRQPKRILVTSALPYANGPIHLGHIAGAYLPADIYVRYQRLKGRDVVFICGSDEHGVPITVTADKEGISPQDVVDRYHAMNQASFRKLGISFDNYSRTSLPIHHQTAQEFFSVMHGKGDLIVKNSEQFYSEKSRRFLPDRYVEGICPHCKYERARGDQCDQCGKWLEPKELIEPKSKIDGTRPVLKATQHWYLPMGRFSDAWKKWFDAKKWKENVRNYCQGWYNEGLGDRPITRDLHWGVPVPLKEAEGKVLYVWFDAPIGYISSTKEWAAKTGNPERWKDYWNDQETDLVHFIGKDNIVFHAILFPMMLMCMGGYVLPAAIPANEYLTINGKKISTSLNYAVWLDDYLKSFPPDPLRYTIASNAPETKDTDFSWGLFQSRNNDELADILGNFINRTLTFVHRYYEGRIPTRGKVGSEDRSMLDAAAAAPGTIGGFLERFEVRNASKAFMDLCRSANKYFNDSAPWQTRTSDPERCATSLNICVQVVRTLSVVMEPFLPFSAARLKAMLNCEDQVPWDEAGKADLPGAHAIGKTEILFSKIENEAIEKEEEKLRQVEARLPDAAEAIPQTIDYDTFHTVDLRTAKVLSAEKVQGADKLLKLQIDLGSEKRQIIAGVAQYYTPEQMAGRTVLVVSNLKPVKIRGIESQGMLLAVRSEKGLILVTTERETPPGLRAE
jgi:methionyl-tRNA synthetase